MKALYLIQNGGPLVPPCLWRHFVQAVPGGVDKFLWNLLFKLIMEMSNIELLEKNREK